MVFETAHSSFTRLLSALTLILLGGLFLAASARGQDRYVATTGDDTANDCTTEATPCLTISHALDEAVDGDAIHIADGTYIENVTISNNVTVQSTALDPAAVVVDGNGAGSVFTIQAGNTVTLESLTIQNGSATLGGGINNAGDLTVNNLVVQNNVATLNGGGMFNSGSSPTLENVDFIGNTAAAGGGMAADASSITVENGSFTENTAVDGAGGGAIYAIESDLTLSNVLVDNNHAEGGTTNSGDGGGIHVQDGNLTLNNNSTVSNNTTAGLASEGGGIWVDSGQLVMTDSQCTGNQTGPEDLSRGGCAFVDDATNVDISGSTIMGNETTAATNGPGGGLAVLGQTASIVITNTEFTDNHTVGTDADGGGIWLIGGEMTVEIIGSTISGNSTDGPDGSGGGMWMQGDGSQGTLSIEDTEFTANSTAAGDSPAGALRVAGIDGTVTIANSTFSNNSTAGFSSWGGAFVAAAINELNIIDTEFTGNSTADVASGGGAMAFNADSTPVINLTNVTCDDNHTGNVDLPLEGLTNAGCLGINNAIANDATEVNIAGSSFTNNSVTGSSEEAGQWGGGAIVMNGDNLTFAISNTTIDGNATEGANGEGGGIWLAGGEMTGEIIGSTISGNSTNGPGGPGGGIWMQGGGSQGTLTVEDTEFTGNTAAAGGGMAAAASSITVENGSFTENTAVDGAGGGAIYAIESDVTLNSVLVDNNHAEGGTTDSGDGGGIHVQTGNLTLNNNTTVSNNTTAGDASEGGGIWVDSGQLFMTDSQCTGNQTGPEDLSRGGCAFVDDATGVDISGSTIMGNETTAVTNGSGGGLVILALAGSVAPVVIADTEFTDNRTVGTDAPGGAIVMRGDNLTFAITNTTIDGNATEGANGEGGGIWLADGVTGTIVGSTLSNNSAETVGGGLYNGNNGMVELTEVVFSNNVAGENGGGMANLSDSSSELYGTTFTENEAGDLGGGLYNEGALTVTHSTVSGNGGTNGAGLFNDGALNLMNSTVSGNVATGNGGGLNNFGILTVVHSTASGNSVAGGGGGLFNNGTATFTNSLVVNSIQSAVCEGSGTLNTEGVNFDDDGSCAGFTNDPDAGGLLGPLADNRGLTETHALLEGNPALEAAGDCVNEFGITDDQRGAPRPQGTACDAGAFELTNDLDAAPVAGWRLIAPPGDGLTVQDLADINLVQGVTGSYPGTDFPNVFWLYDGPTEEDYTAFTSVDDALEPGRGIWWYLYDDTDFSGTPPPEFVDIEDFAFPFPFGSALSEDTEVGFTDVPVLGAENPVPAYMIGNPYDAAFQLAGVSTDVAGLQTNFFAWEPNEGAGTYQALDQADYVSPWQGLMSEVDNEDEAPTYSFDFGSVNEEEFPPIIGLRASTSFALNLKLHGTLEGGQPVADFANRLRFEADAMLAWDRHDGSKFMPPLTTPAHALLSPGGLRDGQPYRQSVRSLPGELEEDFTVPVAFLASGSGSFEISAEPVNLPDGWGFVLRDLATDEETNLLEESYTFNAGATEDWEERFEVTVTPAGVVGTEGDGPAELHLSNPAPNPATGSTGLVLQVPEAQHVAAHVYDTLGRLVSTVHDGSLTAGEEVRFEIDTSSLAAGAYVMRVEGETFAETRRFTVVR